MEWRKQSSLVIMCFGMFALYRVFKDFALLTTDQFFLYFKTNLTSVQ
jgi:hypothetical protein